MNISELSRLSGVTPPTIRYYEQEKLLPKAERSAGGYRKYSDTDLKLLNLIKKAQQVGFSLAEIRAMLPVKANGWNHDMLLGNLRQKVADIEKLERELAESKQSLLAVIQAIDNKPDNISCEENAQRLLDSYG